MTHEINYCLWLGLKGDVRGANYDQLRWYEHIEDVFAVLRCVAYEKTPIRFVLISDKARNVLVEEYRD